MEKYYCIFVVSLLFLLLQSQGCRARGLMTKLKMICTALLHLNVLQIQRSVLRFIYY